MYRASGLSTHTLYAHYSRLKDKSLKEILDLREYLFPEGNATVDNINQYLTPVDIHQAPLQLKIRGLLADVPNAQHQDQVNDLILRLDSYIRRYERAVTGFNESVLHINQLEQDNDIFRSTPGKRNDYLYIMDEETCSRLREQEKLVNSTGHCVFPRSKSVELTGKQTDAIHIRCSNTELTGLRILDRRIYGPERKTIGYGIKLIPPPEYKISNDEKQILFRQADQLTCTLLENLTINDCHLRAENGALQGIFSSEGMYRNLNIQGNTITSKSAHAISIAGLLTGGEFRNNTVCQMRHGIKPAITLYPARIGSNMADDGVLNILSFKKGSELKYGPFGESDNRLQYRGETTALKVMDLRSSVPDMFVHFAAGLYDFDYQAYRAEYSNWTMRDFKARDPEGYSLMHDWIVLREWEYRHGQREAGSLLPPPTQEQRALGANTVLGMLTKARVAIQSGHRSFYDIRLADLPYTPVRSFVMKRIASRHGRVQSMKNLGVYNNFRKANLEFLLPETIHGQTLEGVA